MAQINSVSFEINKYIDFQTLLSLSSIDLEFKKIVDYYEMYVIKLQKFYRKYRYTHYDNWNYSKTRLIRTLFKDLNDEFLFNFPEYIVNKITFKTPLYMNYFNINLEQVEMMKDFIQKNKKKNRRYVLNFLNLSFITYDILLFCGW